MSCQFCPRVVDNIEHQRKSDRVVMHIDMEKTLYQGLKWKELGNFGKRKLENILVITHLPNRLEFNYA